MKFAQSLVFFALPLLAAASPLVARTDCNSGSLQCCNQAVPSNDAQISSLLGLLGIVNNLKGAVGLSCSPITVIGLASGGCKQQTYCCVDNSHSFISLGCSSFNIAN